MRLVRFRFPPLLARNEQGQAMVLMALAMTAMCGMAALGVDAGMLLQQKRAIQNATDAAVLAAAAYLPANEAIAVDKAIEFSGLNGFALAPGDVWITSTSAANDTIQINNDVTVNLAFARVLGFTTGTPAATASAQVGAVTAGSGVMPFGIDDQTFVFGTSYCLKLGTGNCGGQHKGNFHALDIDDHGNDSSSIYEDKIRHGSSKQVHIGDVKNVSSGNMAGPTRKGVGCQGSNGRLTGNNQAFSDVVQDNGAGAFRVLDWESPRLVLVPIVDFDGNSTATVLGFAAFFLEGCVGSDAVSGLFIQTVWPGTQWGPLTNSNDHGARAVRLTS